MNDFNAAIIDEFRANDGKVGGPFEGAPMVLLTTTGAKSGQQRTSPLVYLPKDDHIVIFASAAGADTHPAWFHNIKADPNVTVEVGAETYDATAEALEGGPERQALFDEQKAIMPGFADYEAKTSRVIPVVKILRK